MFSKVMIANRGEIAVRVIKTCARLGIKTVVVYSDADAGSLAVEMADEAVRIGPPPAAESYLDIDKIIAAVKATGAEAVHPGFGFLSENPKFAERLKAEGVAFVGPNTAAIEAMGDKIASKKVAADAGVSVVPGHIGEIADAGEAVKIASEIGFPVMIKASAGGGGKGMRVAWDAKEAKEGFQSARNEAKSAFGDERIFIEKFIEQPRHIEIQVLGDKHGSVVHLGERECSIQRRNQKVIEEAPSPFLDSKTRKAMGEQAVALAAAVDYDSAGTVEFIVDKEKRFYFLEMNTRLQVEHPVSEMITGLDLVEQMLRVAAGEKLKLAQKDVKFDGWAVETRIYAEDPYRGFLPSIGRLSRFRPPAEGDNGFGVVRVDTGVVEGDQISLFYDPMIAKLATHGDDRAAAIDSMLAALDLFDIAGIQDNTPFLSAVCGQKRFRDGALTTGYIAEEFPDGFSGVAPGALDRRMMIAAAAFAHVTAVRRAARATGAVAVSHDLEREDWVALFNGERAAITVAIDELGATIDFPKRRGARLETQWRPGERVFSGELDGVPFSLILDPANEGYDVRRRGARERIIVCRPRAAELRASLPEKVAADTGKFVTSPMPGLVVSVAVAEGQDIKAGEALLVVEAMKMENVIRAERDGVVKAVAAAPGASVAADELLIEFE